MIRAKILIADDMASTRQVLDLLLRESGYETITAKNGHEAVAQFHAENPDLIILDVIMGGMDGYDVARAIRASARGEIIPIIFLTVMDDERTLANCLAAGGDDFMTKPFSAVVMRAKIEALLKHMQLYNTVKTQHDELKRRDELTRHEQIVAKKVFDTLMSAGCLHVPTIKARVSSASLFNGDIVLAAAKPSGALQVMLGDLSGIGLSAAIGSLPVSEAFYSMTKKGFSIVDIACEVNKKLKDRLPPEMSLAACLFELDAVEQTITVWNGGLPCAYLYSREAMDVVAAFPSRHSRLGTMDDREFERDVDLVNIQDGDCVVLMTDGMVCAENANGEQFGARRVEDCLRYCYDPDKLVERLIESVSKFRGDASSIDNLSLVAVTADAQVQQLLATSKAIDVPVRELSGEWHYSLEMQHDTLKSIDPVPLIQQALLDLQGDTHIVKDVSLVARELVSNAIEHGVLQLDSKTKATPEGFAKYYSERNTRLQSLESGFVRINLRHIPNQQGGEIRLVVEDSGPGFDRDGHEQTASGASSPKGLNLVDRLVDRIEYNDKGNCVTAILTWRKVN